jgi:hypothetical protein
MTERQCIQVGGMYQWVENRANGTTYVTGEPCAPQHLVLPPPGPGRIDLCPPEWGGNGDMRLDDPRCVRPLLGSSAGGRSAVESAISGLTGSTIGPSFAGGGNGNGLSGFGGGMAGGDGAFLFRGTLSGCGCGDTRSASIGASSAGGTSPIRLQATGAAVTGTANRFIGTPLFWALVAIGVLAATRKKRR